MKALIFVILLMFAGPVAGAPPPCDDVVIIPMELTAFGGEMTDVKIPSVIGDITKWYVFDIRGVTGELGGQIGYFVVVGMPIPKHPLVLIAIDLKGTVRAIALIGETSRLDWIYDEHGCPRKAPIEDVIKMIQKLPEKPTGPEC